MNIRINYISDSWTRIKNHCRTTVNKKFTEKEPTDKFKEELLISEHSPIRCLEVDWTWEDIPYWVSTELSRHKHEKFISSQRDDRNNNEIPRGKKPQDSPVTHDAYANAQNLIDMMRKRLCFMATKEAREAAENLKYELHNYEPQLANVLMPNCLYRAGCPEFETCGFWKKFKEKHPKVDMTDIKERYRAYNEDFYKKFNKE